MTNINFNEASIGEVTEDDKVALEIMNKGRGGGIKSTASFQAVLGESSDAGVVGKSTGRRGIAILGESEHPDGGAGIAGKSKNDRGVFGESETNDGVRGESRAGIGVFGVTNTPLDGNESPNVENEIKGVGVVGIGRAKASVGLWGETIHGEGGAGVVGRSNAWRGVHGQSTTNVGVYGVATGEKASAGVVGETTHDTGGAGVIGKSKNWIGVFGESKSSVGIQGVSDTSIAVQGIGKLKGSIGVWGETPADGGGAGVVGINNAAWIGVHGIAKGEGGHGVMGEVQHEKGGAGVIGKSINWIGVYGESLNHVGVWGKSINGGIAARFEGQIHCTGTIEQNHADCAEDFDIDESESVEVGTVMVLIGTGSLQPSYQEYDKKVVGIISGGGGYKPAIVLDRQQILDQENGNKNKDRLPVALMGKVYCKVDATNSAIEIGDLLTTSSSKGYAMKAEDPAKAFGAVIGKALDSIKEGMGMIRVLVTLQ
jgi:hypothetical protein